MNLKFEILIYSTFLLTACNNINERTILIIPDEHLTNKLNKANATQISFPELELNEVLIFGGEHTYKFTSKDNCTYKVKFKHIANDRKMNDLYYDPDYMPTIYKHKILNETYKIDSCVLSFQNEFGRICIDATPQNSETLTNKQINSIRYFFKNTLIEKYDYRTNVATRASEHIISDTSINNLIVANKTSMNRKISNIYSDIINKDSIYSFFYRNHDYFKSILINGDIINFYSNKGSKVSKDQILKRQYVYMNTSKSECIGCCGVGHINHKISCIYINHQ